MMNSNCKLPASTLSMHKIKDIIELICSWQVKARRVKEQQRNKITCPRIFQSGPLTSLI